MLEWLCVELMQAEVSAVVGADKNSRSSDRTTSRSGYRPRRFDTRMGTMYLMVPKVRSGGYIPFFVTARKKSEAALIAAVQEAYIQGISTRKMDKLVKSLGAESISASQVSVMTKELNEQAEAFRNRPLEDEYPILWTDALYEKVRIDGRVAAAAVLIVCGVNGSGRREILSSEVMLEESAESYRQVFENLKDRGLSNPKLIISDANAGLVKAIRESFTGASWQRCKVHFMRNILAHIPHREKAKFAGKLKEIWNCPDISSARMRADELMRDYDTRFPKAVRILEDGLEDSLAFYSFPQLDPRKISSANMIETE